MIISTIHAKGLGAATAIAMVLAIAAPGTSHAESRPAGHPAHENALPRPPMRPQTGMVAAAPAAQAQRPHVMPSSGPPVAMGHVEDSGHTGEQGRDRGHDFGPRDARIIVVVPSDSYYGPQTSYAPGYDGDPTSDGGPAVASAPLGDTGANACAQAYSSYDPQSGSYIGDDGNAHPCP
jgi:hypothetical protein